ncbi:nucleoside phosphorylase domain-containing protein [Aspergillus californicus]
MSRVLFQQDTLMSHIVSIQCCILLGISESATVASMTTGAKEKFASAKQALPFLQRIIINLFAKVVVGTATIADDFLPVQDTTSMSIVDAPIIGFEYNHVLTQAWNEYGSSAKQGRHQRGQRSISSVLSLRSSAQHRHSHVLSKQQPVIVVKLVADWWKMTSAFLLSVYLAILTSPTDNRAKRIASSVVILSLVLAYLARFMCRKRGDRYGPEGKTQTNESDDVAREQSGSLATSPTPEEEPVPGVFSLHTPSANRPNTISGNNRAQSFNVGSQPLRYRDYTIGWICVLPVELAVAQAMLDEVHELLPGLGLDGNTYILGRICSHNIVLSCLPNGIYGPITAATVAARMLLTFPSIRFGLVVGIGGGVPGQKDIRLGDIVVSQPTPKSPGVLQCGTSFRLTSALNNPPQVLLNALSNLRARHLIEGNRIAEILLKVSEKHPMLRDNIKRGEHDRLFHVGYEHTGASNSCNDCNKRRLVIRSLREGNDPQIHYGPIASVTRVIRNATTRDTMAQSRGVLCFEMEAAGLMDNFPCLVIRGISDYSDSHKNDDWQGYAAATAAAYAKELLSVIPAREVNLEREASRLRMFS